RSMSDTQELRLQALVRIYEVAENGTQVLWKSSNCSYPLSHLSSTRSQGVNNISRHRRRTQDWGEEDTVMTGEEEDTVRTEEEEEDTGLRHPIWALRMIHFSPEESPDWKSDICIDLRGREDGRDRNRWLLQRLAWTSPETKALRIWKGRCWEVAGDHIQSGAGGSDNDYLILTLHIPGFKQ
ncbi:hypothetical protein STEG23_032377, partial [Scotinomys teguina]